MYNTWDLKMKKKSAENNDYPHKQGGGGSLTFNIGLD